ncbi:MAG: patatin-like phospholipase family protein [Myxococcota bacterium]
MVRSDPPRTALVLSGGGARGAYQVGVLRGLLDLGVLTGDGRGLDIIVGSSAGSINAGALAARADDLTVGIERLEQVWGHIEAQQVFRTDLRSLGGIGAKWIRDLSFGGVLKNVSAQSLLDTAPLRELLESAIPFEHIADNIRSGALRGLAILATDLENSDGVIFLQASEEIVPWERTRWVVEPTRIGAGHLMASSAIPIFFPSIEVDGRHLGDGCIRNTTPLSPAINMGAERVVAIGVREARDPQRIVETSRGAPPSVAQIAGVLLDAVMLDAIEVDVAHSERVNTSVELCRTPDPASPFHWVDVLWLGPSQSIASIAAEMADHIPRIVRYLMRGLGSDEATTELTSYLLFDPAFCQRLMEMGRQDVLDSRDSIESFFAGERPPLPPPAR